MQNADYEVLNNADANAANANATANANANASANAEQNSRASVSTGGYSPLYNKDRLKVTPWVSPRLLGKSGVLSFCVAPFVAPLFLTSCCFVAIDRLASFILLVCLCVCVRVCQPVCSILPTV